MRLDRKYENPIVLHLFYELGYLFNGLEENIGEDDILAIEVFYSCAKKIQFPYTKDNKIKLFLREIINFDDYKNNFNQWILYLKINLFKGKEQYKL